jgi:DNA invertase Pin-like site-specific DNA recombinase
MTPQPQLQGRRIGYIRQNTLCGDLQHQLEGLLLDRMFKDTISQKRQFLAQFAAMMSYVRAGDTLIVQSIDRLARNPEEFFRVMYTLNSKGVRVECIAEDLIIPAEADAALGHFILLIMNLFWKTSQSWISERHREARPRPTTTEDDVENY